MKQLLTLIIILFSIQLSFGQSLPFGIKTNSTDDEIDSILIKKGFVKNGSIYTIEDFALNGVSLRVCYFTRYGDKLHNILLSGGYTKEVSDALYNCKNTKEILEKTFKRTPTMNIIPTIKYGRDLMNITVLKFTSSKVNIIVNSLYEDGYFRITIEYINNSVQLDYERGMKNLKKYINQKDENFLK